MPIRHSSERSPSFRANTMPLPVGRDVGVVGPRTAREPAYRAARERHAAQVAVDEVGLVHLQLGVDERLAVGRPREPGAAVAQREAAVVRCRRVSTRRISGKRVSVWLVYAIVRPSGLKRGEPWRMPRLVSARASVSPRLRSASASAPNCGARGVGPGLPLRVQARARHLVERAAVEPGRKLDGVLARQPRQRVRPRTSSLSRRRNASPNRYGVCPPGQASSA